MSEEPSFSKSWSDLREHASKADMESLVGDLWTLSIKIGQSRPGLGAQILAQTIALYSAEMSRRLNLMSEKALASVLADLDKMAIYVEDWESVLDEGGSKS